ncbi:MAG: hypothetical protein EOS81_22480 [Mesorhizobium sp.]|uniref:hypothetical protein n=1 Tax=Mesorhizobium sp. TaxID=1871066 RepID=UPI000FE94998|nr:MAG: hypothetical protein EOS81_22480 [Mesorhizobium sp.]
MQNSSFSHHTAAGSFFGPISVARRASVEIALLRIFDVCPGRNSQIWEMFSRLQRGSNTLSRTDRCRVRCSDQGLFIPEFSKALLAASIALSVQTFNTE